MKVLEKPHVADLETIPQVFLRAMQHAKPACVQHKVDGKYVAISSAELTLSVARLYQALAELGVAHGDRIGLISSNCPAWHLVDFAVAFHGAVLVPIDPLLHPHEKRFVLENSGIRFLFVRSAEELEALGAADGQLPALEGCFVLEGPGSESLATLEELLTRGRSADPEVLRAAARNVAADDLATIIYTSGTTSKPKGVMLSHRNLVSTIRPTVSRMDLYPHQTGLSFLPLCYVFERVEDYCYLLCGVTISYTRSSLSFLEEAPVVRPHVFVSVPRLYERIVAILKEKIRSAPPRERRRLERAVAVGRRCVPYRLRDQPLPLVLGLRWRLADRRALRGLRAIFGGRIENCGSGGARLNPEVAEFLWAIGVPVYEGYGLTETSPTITLNYRGKTRLGSVGVPFPEVEVRLSEEGEILARGPNVMVGYAAGSAAIPGIVDADGWIHTGDIGTIDGEGFVTITGRKKHMIINAYGLKLVPEPVEEALKENPLIADALVVGEGQPFYGVLLVPQLEALRAWAAREGIEAAGDAELLAHPRVLEVYDRAVDAIAERPEKFDPLGGFRLLPEPFSFAKGEVTATLKVRRAVVAEHYRDLIDSIYAGQGADF